MNAAAQRSAVLGPTTAEPGDSSFMRRMSECFARAAAQRRVPYAIELADRRISLEFAGAALPERLTEFLATATTRSNNAPELSVKIWDTESTGVEPPPPPAGALLGPGGYATIGAQRLAFSAVSSTLQVYDAQARTAYYWVRSPSAVACWECAAPFRTLFAWWAESFGAVMAHAAVFGDSERGLLLVGASGAGKSTSALACLERGLGFLSDDCALLTMDAALPVAHCAYRTAKVAPTPLSARSSALRKLETRLVHDRGKLILALPRGDPRLLQRSRIRAVVTQAVARDGQTRLRREAPGRALQALAPSTLLQTPGTSQRTLDVLTEVVGRVPCYSLEAGNDLAHVAHSLEELLR